MNALGSFYTMVWLIKPKIKAISTMWINHFGVVPKDSITE
jgi:hypothetical protein